MELITRAISSIIRNVQQPKIRDIPILMESKFNSAFCLDESIIDDESSEFEDTRVTIIESNIEKISIAILIVLALDKNLLIFLLDIAPTSSFLDNPPLSKRNAMMFCVELDYVNAIHYIFRVIARIFVFKIPVDS